MCWRRSVLGALLTLLGLGACSDDGTAPPDGGVSERDAAPTARDAATDAGTGQAPSGGFDASADASASDAQVATAPDADYVLPYEGDAMTLADGAVLCGDAQDRIYVHSLRGPALEGCTIFRGSVDFTDTSLTRIAFPRSLRSIEGALNFFRNEQLADIRALGNLELAGQLSFNLNGSLETLSGLERLRAVRGVLSISSNGRLRSLSALSALESVGDLIAYGGMLPEAEFDRLAAQVKLARLDAGL